ncbi:MAG: DUF455 family protein [Candidatus Melainabacteria bacterium]|nr:DUF455 family protein [Candidatus Melainabacteria bacterium]
MNWEPFQLAEGGKHPPPPRSLESKEGIGDRLRSAAFAEFQAREAFLWAADHFQDAPVELKQAWRTLAKEEDKHLNWLLTRMKELGFEISSRQVSDHLWHSLVQCKTAEEFAVFMASAEERGQRAGFRFSEGLKKIDGPTAAIFQKIAEEETSHIQLTRQFFPNSLQRKLETGLLA